METPRTAASKQGPQRKDNRKSNPRPASASAKSAGPKTRPAKAAPPAVSAAIPPANATPVKAYAGPTFHASPAASSLPIPKFLSRSVPNGNKTNNLEHLLEQDAPDTDSDIPESPSKVGKRPPNPGPSPLDILFQADRHRRSKPAATLSPHMQASPRPNDRHFALSDDIFAMESDSRKTPVALNAHIHDPQAASRSSWQKSSPSRIPPGASPSLHVPPFIRSHSEVDHPVTVPSPYENHARGLPLRPPNSTAMQALVESQLAPKANGVSSHRNFADAQHKPPLSPGHTTNQDISVLQSNHHSPTINHTNGYGPHVADRGNLKLMEDDLRRLLKLDAQH